MSERAEDVEQPEPDTKDWTWVLERRCAECGFDSREPQRDQLAAITRDLAVRWAAAVDGRADVALRPSPGVWSPVEYAAHVRDAYALAVFRTNLMLDNDDPTFPNWDQDVTAVESDYPSSVPAEVLAGLSANANEFADVLDVVPEGAWGRTGVRSDGSRFTVESFARYLVHDPVHHLWDVTGERWV